MVSEVAAHLDISYGSAYAILHDDLGYRKVCAQWVPKELTVVRKQQRVETVTQLVRQYEEDLSILERTVTSDEKLVHHYDLESKRQSKEWRHPSSPAQKKFKRQPSTKKVMLTLFWDMHGPILVHFQVRGQRVNSVNYCAICCEMNLNLQFARKEEECCPKMSYCIMIMHVLIQQQ